jgi:hypothetical protein
MIHIATVHWQDDKWIDIQLDHFQKYITEDYRIYAFLNVPNVKDDNRFYYISKENIRQHDIKLNILADIIRFSSSNHEDLIFFIDGDAFPINDIVKFVRSKIEKHKLIAIQRLENNGDLQPHPSFCATTIKFWSEINGDWHKGDGWKNYQGREIKDVGGALLRILNESKVNWYKMHRSRSLNENPVCYGIYEDVIYHHGSGFRNNINRALLYNNGLIKPYKRLLLKLLKRIPNDLVRRIKFKIKNRLLKESNLESDEIFTYIKKQKPFL